jgi:anti-sigma factor RsiW
MTCGYVSSKLSAYVDGEVNGHEMLSIREHLQRCSTCSKELESLRTIKRLISGLPMMDPDDELLDRLKARVASETPAKEPALVLRRPLIWAPALVAGVVSALMLIYRGSSSSTEVQGGRARDLDRVVIESSPRISATFDEAMQATADPLGVPSPVITVNHGRR